MSPSEVLRVAVGFAMVGRQYLSPTLRCQSGRQKNFSVRAGHPVEARAPPKSANLSGTFLRYGLAMPECKHCGEDVDSVASVKVDGKTKKLCEDCADLVSEQANIAEQSEAAVQQMMGFTGRR
jgi:hypothetical protein